MGTSQAQSSTPRHQLVADAVASIGLETVARLLAVPRSTLSSYLLNASRTATVFLIEARAHRLMPSKPSATTEARPEPEATNPAVADPAFVSSYSRPQIHAVRICEERRGRRR
jgi:hypothetical protein